MRYWLLAIYLFITYLIGQWLSEITGAVVYAGVALPGTVVHESLHWIAALILNGDPEDFSIVPVGSVLGQIKFVPNWYNAATVALAPLFLIPITVWAGAVCIRTTNLIKIALLLWLGACAWSSCVPSVIDLNVALLVPSSWPLAILLFGLVFSFSWYIVQKSLQKV